MVVGVEDSVPISCVVLKWMFVNLIVCEGNQWHPLSCSTSNMGKVEEMGGLGEADTKNESCV